MEFNEKLQELRKQKGLTQEELASALYVSRAAVSKWESGRGYPNIDSLKAMAAFFSVTIDDLLSDGKVESPAEEHRPSNGRRDLLFGLLDWSSVLLLFLPFFGQKVEGRVQAVSLPALTEAASYMRIAYGAVIAGLVLSGILMVALRREPWSRYKRMGSILLGAVGALLFIVGSQPYAATFLFLCLLGKVLIAAKNR